MDDFQTFADNYTSADFDKIKFDWNGEHAEKLRDNNSAFRMPLCEFLIPQLDTVNLELIRDLYNEVAKYSKEVWGVYDKFHLLGQQLLIRGGTKYLMDYMQGASLSQDTYLGSGRIEISKELAQQILNYMEERIKVSTDEKEKQLITQFKNRFEWLATKTK